MFDDAQDALDDLTRRTTNGYEPARAERQSHPRGFEPGVKRTPGQWLVTTPPMEQLADESAWQKAVDSLGLDVPEGWRVRLVEMRYDPAAWHRDREGADAVTRPVWRYRFAVEECPETAGSNVDDLVKQVKGIRQRQPKEVGGEGTFVVSWNDWQLFKNAGDGIEGTVSRIIESFEIVLVDVADEVAVPHRVVGVPGALDLPRCHSASVVT